MAVQMAAELMALVTTVTLVVTLIKSQKGNPINDAFQLEYML